MTLPVTPLKLTHRFFPRFFASEMKENIYGGGMAKITTKNGEDPDEGPAVGMQLGRGDVYHN